MKLADGFLISAQDEPHKSRSQAIIRKYPQVKQLIGQNRWTFVLLCSVLIIQLSIAFWIGQLDTSYWWIIPLAAFSLGAFMNHALYVIIHEATHNLIFKKRLWNKMAGVLADVPNVLPGALAFRNYHIKHHAYMGDHDFDADLPNTWEAKLVGHSWWRKAIWLLFFPLVQASRSLFSKKVTTYEPWFYINAIVLLATNIWIVSNWGWASFAYLLCSMFFGLGLHPVGARWIQEHFTLDPEQETYSYYGPLNIPSLNVGYHNEHHDFPAVPWNRLPQLRAMAPEFYDSLKYHKSWSGLLIAFLFDKNYTLYSRIIRSEEVKAGQRIPDEALDVQEVGLV